jgi:mono/diheme cytochrome c family protein
MKSNRSLAVPALAALVLVAGCRQDMHNQPKYRPLRPSTLFADGSSARQPVEGTVARGTLQTDEALFTGMSNGTPVTEMPFAITANDLDRGQERYNIFCAPCHDQTGSGTGMVVQRGYRQPPSFHIERLKTVEPGYMFDVITNGFGVMPDYRAQIDPRDRWRIIAYVKALQLSQPTVAEPAPGEPGATTPPPGTQPEGSPQARPGGRGGQGGQ